MPDYFAHQTAIIDQGAQIGAGTRIWHFSHICATAVIGQNCNLGQNVMVADQVVVGNQVKIQNNVSVYTGVTLEDDVFLGPSCVLTNITNPRSQIVRRNLYEQTLVRRGATVGANATIVSGVTLGRYCFIAAGAVVTGDVADYELIVGVPGKTAGFMSRHGHRLTFNQSDEAVCPESGFRYRIADDQVRCLDLDEEEALPGSQATGASSYDTFRQSENGLSGEHG